MIFNYVAQKIEQEFEYKAIKQTNKQTKTKQQQKHKQTKNTKTNKNKQKHDFADFIILMRYGYTLNKYQYYFLYLT